MLQLEYNGRVNISYRKDNKIHKITQTNNGTEQLFNFFAKALCKQDLTALYPETVQLFMIDLDSNEAAKSTNCPISYREVKIETDSNNNTLYEAVFTSMIPKFLIESGSFNNVKLISANNSKLASIDLDNSISSDDIPDESQLIIEWILYVTNPSN